MRLLVLLALAALQVACYGPRQSGPPDPDAHYTYPNPFSPVSQIEIDYVIEDSSLVTIVFYNVRGDVLDTILNELRPPGEHRLTFVPDPSYDSGVYFYAVKHGDTKFMKKIVLLK